MMRHAWIGIGALLVLTAAATTGCGDDGDGGSGGSGTGTGAGASGGTGGTGGTGAGTGGTGGTASGTGGAGGTGTGSGGCTNTGFDVVDDHIRDATPVVSYYLAEGDAAAPMDLLIIQSWHDLGAPVGAYVFDFNGENYSSCDTCAVFGSGCPAPTGMGDSLMYDLPSCDKVFLVVSGQLTVTGAGASYAGTLTDATAVEVTVDWNGDFTSTEVAGGDSWCLDTMSFPMP